MGVNHPAVSKDVQEAFRATCFEFDVAELAPLMGMSPGVLYNKCNANDSSHHKPTLQDLVLSQVITRDKRATHALARLMGGVFIDLSGLKSASDQAVLDIVTAWMKEQGDLFAAFHEAYGDGVIDARDYKRIRKEAFDVLEAVMTFLKRIEGMRS